MNRIHLGLCSSQTPSRSRSRVNQDGAQAFAEASSPCALFAPLHYERNYAYPLLVWLHGPNDDERQLQRIMPRVSLRNYVAVGPRGSCPTQRDPPGFQWRQTDRDIALAEKRVWGCIQLARKQFNIAPARIFIGGYDCGGTMAFRIALNCPTQFAGILSVGGPFPNGSTPLVNLQRARQLPLFIAQGRRSTRYPAERTCKDLRLLHAAGFFVTLRQYPCGDELTARMLHDMDVWMMEQVTGVPSSIDDGQLSSDQMG